jgi:hypothetical protein
MTPLFEASHELKQAEAFHEELQRRVPLANA